MVNSEELFFIKFHDESLLWSDVAMILKTSAATVYSKEPLFVGYK